MIYLKVKEDNLVELIHYKPELLDDEMIGRGILVNSIPEPEQIEGKSAVLYCNPETKELWYEYEDIPKTEEELQAEKVESLEQSIAELTMAMTMMMGGM